MNQDHLMQYGLKDQQYWIVWSTLLFDGAGAKNVQNGLLSKRLWMFVMTVTYFVIITRALRKNQIKN